MCGKMELWDHPSNNVVVQTFSILKREVLQLRAEIFGPLAHDIVRCDLLRLEIVAGTSNNGVINICESKRAQLSQERMDLGGLTYFLPFWSWPAPSGRTNSWVHVVQTTPVVEYPFENFEFACSTADKPVHVLVCEFCEI
jgi:hypothetical protein